MKGGGTTLAKKQAEYKNGGVCTKCKHRYDYLTVEHVIPVFLLIELGLADMAYDDAENMEPLCIGCNKQKGGHLDPFHPKTHALLARYVQMSRDKYALVNAQKTT